MALNRCISLTEEETINRGEVVERVRLIKAKAPKELPEGTLGTVIDGTMKKRGMLRVKWDTGHVIPMYWNELASI